METTPTTAEEMRQYLLNYNVVTPVALKFKPKHEDDVYWCRMLGKLAFYQGEFEDMNDVEQETPYGQMVTNNVVMLCQILNSPKIAA